MIATTMIERREGHFTGQGEIDLFYQTWSPTDSRSPTRKTLVITHGFAEHSECYRNTADKMASRGWDVCAWDLRGHGRSEGKRGYIANFNDYSADLGCFLRFLKESKRIDDNFVLVGHSMGGLITLMHRLEDNQVTPKPKALALSSPQLGLSVQVPVIKDVAARVLSRLLPSVTLFNELKYNDLTHDPEFLKSYAADALRHDKISPAVYLGMLEQMALVRQNVGRFRDPILIQAAGQEKIVSLPATLDFFAKLQSPEKELIVYQNSYHEIFNDVEREQVFTDLDRFLLSTLGNR
jgi:alpha-beta hydrolase superfamily lysophospholipase